MVINFPLFGGVEIPLSEMYLREQVDFDAWYSIGKYLDLHLYYEDEEWTAILYPVCDGKVNASHTLDQVTFALGEPEYVVQNLDGGHAAIIHKPSGRTVDVLVFDRKAGYARTISGQDPEYYGVKVAYEAWGFDSDCESI